MRDHARILSRRGMLTTAVPGAAIAVIRPAWASAVPSGLIDRAKEALDRHRIAGRDLIAVADFSRPSRQPRFHLVDIASGRTSSFLVAHGRGSDPRHTGWLEQFSNAPGSYATSAGAYKTETVYSGAHGRSIRLAGLDASNNNALSRAIVVHGAWYVSQAMATTHGVLGRSQGCFALCQKDLGTVMERLTPGHLIYADKIGA